MSFTQPTLTVEQQTEIAAYVNALRAKHQAPPLVWDNSIYSFSQGWSYYLSSNNLFQHSTNNAYGENLAYFQGYGSDPMVLIKLSIDSWYNEVLHLCTFKTPILEIHFLRIFTGFILWDIFLFPIISTFYDVLIIPYWDAFYCMCYIFF